MSCEHDCTKPPVFPAAIYNRPGLEQIRYRIGDYGRFRAHMLAALDQQHRLSAWTHRSADDPGIALLEGTAILGDILALYQSLYANEAFLRTAQWRDSISSLVQLTGYRLAAGVGGEALFAVAVDGAQPVTVPLGFGFKVQLQAQESPAIFESTAEAAAYPALSQFQLYRPRQAMPNITTGMASLELHAVHGALDLASRQAVAFSPGDRIMLVPDASVYDAGGGAYSVARAQARAEMLIVKEVETVLDRIIIHFEGALTVDRGTTIRAFKIDRSFRHFGYNAPHRIGKLNETTGIMHFESTLFDRAIRGDHIFNAADAAFYSNLRRAEMPLDTKVDNFPVGGQLICQGETIFRGITAAVRFAVVREVTEQRPDTLVWGGMANSCTVLTLRERLIANDDILRERADIRRVQFHEVISPELTLRAPSLWQDGNFGLDTELVFFGTYAAALALAGRTLLIEDAEGVLQQVRVATTVAELAAQSSSLEDDASPRLWHIRLDQPPRYPRESFDEMDNRLTVYGNLVPANQGETQKEAALGNGDARQVFQTFALPKAPLTYLLDQTQTPPGVPALEIYVDHIIWQRVDNFFNSGPPDQVYIVREDEQGNSYVQFGDGKTGGRLPSGLKNVVARFRVGSGARGDLESDAKPKATGKLKPLQDVFMPGPAVGGADPETADNARTAAPMRLQSLGRLVALADYEAEALMLPGVLKARADWVAPTGVPRIRLVVLTAGGNEADNTKVAASISTANAARGAARFSVETIQGIRQYLHLDLTVGYAANRRAEDIAPAVRTALGVTGEEGNGIDGSLGLFGLPQRGLGQGAHVSQVIGAVQQVEGVSWVRVDAFQAIPLGLPPQTDPAALAIPVSAVRHAGIDAAANAILTLHTQHLRLSLTQDNTGKGV